MNNAIGRNVARWRHGRPLGAGWQTHVVKVRSKDDEKR